MNSINQTLYASYGNLRTGIWPTGSRCHQSQRGLLLGGRSYYERRSIEEQLYYRILGQRIKEYEDKMER